MTSDGIVLGVYGFLTSRDFHRVQEHTIRSSGEKVMTMQRHEGMKQHRGSTQHLRARGAVFLVLSHAPAWATKMSPNLIYLKAHPRVFHGGYKLDLGRHKNRGLEGRETEI